MRRLGSEESELTKAFGHGPKILARFNPSMRSPVLPSYNEWHGFSRATPGVSTYFGVANWSVEEAVPALDFSPGSNSRERSGI